MKALIFVIKKTAIIQHYKNNDPARTEKPTFYQIIYLSNEKLITLHFLNPLK